MKPELSKSAAPAASPSVGVSAGERRRARRKEGPGCGRRQGWLHELDASLPEGWGRRRDWCEESRYWQADRSAAPSRDDCDWQPAWLLADRPGGHSVATRS